ncbi:MAG: ribonuclease E/G [Bacteroidetes bacterium]|nr:MAG: ribonuclease E/G [Bacteroidota bacterium]
MENNSTTKKELIINVTNNEIIISLLEDKKLVEYYKDKNNIRFNVGDVYIGRVKKIMSGLNAAFVDVGYEKDAFLHYLDLGHQYKSLEAYFNLIKKTNNFLPLQNFTLLDDIDKNGKIGNVLKSGQQILVQIAKEPISSKGPRLSSELSIAGRNLVLIPFSNKVSISQKIKSTEEKNRLKKLVTSIKPANYGVIIRTASEGKKVAELDTEIKSLVDKWESSFKNIINKNVIPPKLFLSEIDKTTAKLRDIINDSFSNIWVNDNVVYTEIKNYLQVNIPEKEKIIKLYNGKVPIFDNFDIEKQIKGLFGKTVVLNSGVYLVIEHTEALHVVDVNSGNLSKSKNDQESNALEVNLLAAKEISRQLRLRDMGGIIVIDFIDMANKENRFQLYNVMREYMKTDKAKHHILQLSRFGLMQITRQRVRPETNIKTLETCPTCGGTGEISPSILYINELENHISYLKQNTKHTKITLKVHPYIEAYINKGVFKSIRKLWQKKYNLKIKLTSSFSVTFLEYHFFNENNEEIFI